MRPLVAGLLATPMFTIRRETRGGAFVPPEIFRILRSNFDICGSFHVMKLNFCRLF